MKKPMRKIMTNIPYNGVYIPGWKNGEYPIMICTFYAHAEKFNKKILKGKGEIKDIDQKALEKILRKI